MFQQDVIYRTESLVKCHRTEAQVHERGYSVATLLNHGTSIVVKVGHKELVSVP